MEGHRNAQAVHPLEGLVDHLLRRRQLALPVLFAARAARQVGRGEGGGAALRRAVDGDFHAANFQALVVLAPVGHGELAEDFLYVGDERVGNHVNAVGACSRRALKGLQRCQVGHALVRGGNAGLGVHAVRGLCALNFLLRRERLRFLEHRQKGRFHDQTIRLVGSWFAHNDAACGRLGLRVYAVILQRQAVEHGAVHGHMVHPHRVVWERPVEVIAIEQAPVGHDRVVVAVGQEHFALG